MSRKVVSPKAVPFFLPYGAVCVKYDRVMCESITADKPFVFYTDMHLREATGRKASNLAELLAGIREVEGSVIFYHTYGSLLRYNFMVPAPVSDFDFWVEHSLHDELMAEKLSGIDTVSYSTIREIREAHIAAIEQHLSSRKSNSKAQEGDEFHFVKANSFVLPTERKAQDLQEFRNCLASISNDSLYFHLFEARLRLEQPTNDFSFWLGENFQEEELAQFVARQDPYVQTLDQIRAKILKALDDRLSRLEEG